MWHITEEDVKRWHNTVQKWGRGNSAEECRDTFECLQDLTSFLEKLDKDLGEGVGY